MGVTVRQIPHLMQWRRRRGNCVRRHWIGCVILKYLTRGGCAPWHVQIAILESIQLDVDCGWLHLLVQGWLDLAQLYLALVIGLGAVGDAADVGELLVCEASTRTCPILPRLRSVRNVLQVHAYEQ